MKRYQLTRKPTGERSIQSSPACRTTLVSALCDAGNVEDLTFQHVRKEGEWWDTLKFTVGAGKYTFALDGTRMANFDVDGDFIELSRYPTSMPQPVYAIRIEPDDLIHEIINVVGEEALTEWLQDGVFDYDSLCIASNSFKSHEWLDADSVTNFDIREVKL